MANSRRHSVFDFLPHQTGLLIQRCFCPSFRIHAAHVAAGSYKNSGSYTGERVLGRQVQPRCDSFAPRLCSCKGEQGVCIRSFAPCVQPRSFRPESTTCALARPCCAWVSPLHFQVSSVVYDFCAAWFSVSRNLAVKITPRWLLPRNSAGCLK